MDETSERSGLGRNPVLLVLLIMLSLLTVGALWLEGRLQNVIRTRKQSLLAQSSALPVLGQVPSFSFVERSGKPFGSDQLAGKTWIADFIFTRCSGPCPAMSEQMSGMQDSLKRNPDILLVSFSADPEFDDPRILSRYARRFAAGTNQWFFLTGKYEAVQSLAKENFKLSMEKTLPSPGLDQDPVIHDTHFILVDSMGRIRGYYDGTSPQDRHRLIQDALLLDKTRQAINPHEPSH